MIPGQWASLGAQTVKNSPGMRETWVQSLGWEDPLEEDMATRSSILAWRIPWPGEPGKLQSMEFSRREYWSRLPCPPPGDLPNPGIKPRSPALQAELPYNPAIPLLGIHTDETRIERDMCTPMFIAALFTITRTWKQPRCPSTDEWIRKL